MYIFCVYTLMSCMYQIDKFTNKQEKTVDIFVIFI